MFLHSVKTYEKIIDLLDQQKRCLETQLLMSQNGMIGRTDAGTRFYFNKANEGFEIAKELRQYSWHWIESIKYIQTLK